MGEISWGMSTIYVDINKWVHAFDRKIYKITVTRLVFW